MVGNFIQIDANNDLPIVQQIQANLKQQILNHELPSGSRLPSMRQISEQLGCSLGIVKQAVNTLTAEGYLRSSPRQGVYVAERTSAIRDIVMIMPSLELENMHQLARGAREGLLSGPYRLVIQAANNDYDEQLHLLEYLDPDLVAGVLICPPPIQEGFTSLEKLQAKGLPCIQLGAYIDGLNMGAVVFDAVELAYQGLSHLLEMGHRNIGVVGIPDNTGTGRDRRTGLAMALEPYGMKPEQLSYVRAKEWNLSADKPWLQGQHVGTQLLTEHPDTTAVLGMNEHMTLGVARAARQMGRKIGKDLSLVSLGDLLIFELLDTEITAVEKPLPRIAARAALRLVELIEGRRTDIGMIQLSPRLISRQSVVQFT